MDQEKRPGGLTALSVINFVIFGLSILGLIGSIATYAGLFPTPPNMTEEQKSTIEAFQNMGISKFTFIITLGFITNALLLVSGIGYLKLKKIMGRYFGNAYGIISIVSGVLSGFIYTSEMGRGFNIGTIIGLIYPVLGEVRSKLRGFSN